MIKGPDWMPLDVGDYLRKTDHLTVVEHGAYLLLIMRYWQKGEIGTDEGLIRRFAHLTAEQWEESRPVLAALFDEGWKHGRIETELAKAAEIIGKRRASAEHMHSKRSANAGQEHSTGSDTRVPPSPSPLVIEPPASVPDAEARASFDEIWKAFPQNPTASEAKAERAWEATKAEDRASILAAAVRYRQWFIEDCEARKRTQDEGLKFVPHLATWLAGDWRKAEALPVKSISAAPDPNLAIIAGDSPEYEAVTRLRKSKGRSAPVIGKSGSTTVTKSELDQARAQAVH